MPPLEPAVGPPTIGATLCVAIRLRDVSAALTARPSVTNATFARIRGLPGRFVQSLSLTITLRRSGAVADANVGTFDFPANQQARAGCPGETALGLKFDEDLDDERAADHIHVEGRERGRRAVAALLSSEGAAIIRARPASTARTG